MKTCDHIEEIIQNFLDGHVQALPAPAQEHLKQCNRCRLFLDEMLLLRKLAADHPAAELGPRGKSLLLRKIERRLTPSRRWRPVLPERAGVPEWVKTLNWKLWLPVGGLAAGLLIWVFSMLNWFSPQPPAAAAVNEMDLFIQEHTLAESRTFFEAPAPTLNLVVLEENPQ